MGKIDGRAQRNLRLLVAIKDCLEIVEDFDLEGAPPEPSTQKERAAWAAFKIQGFIEAVVNLRALSVALPKKGLMGAELEVVSSHIQGILASRGIGYVKRWVQDRGISWREMARPLPSYEGLSWQDLLALSCLGE